MKTSLGAHKIAKVAVIVLGIGLLSYVVGYFASANSDAFIEARSFIIQSSAVSSELGGNIDVQLSPFGYELEFAGSWGVATFDCNVKGSKGKGKVQITLNKTGNIWRVKTATLNINGSFVTL
ncbi:MAG: cytochrome c oxidase assembly factor Coa1 family protein [Sulfuricaulis sp.]